ncbi:MAG: carboxypeptidase regulatory-like domain-containing protein, partial [Thermoanaerobaculia bacterium]
MAFRSRNRIASAALLALLAVLLPVRSALADSITSADLQIQGASLELVTTTATVQRGTPAVIRTRFGGKEGDEAPSVEGVVAQGDLTGPGIDAPITVTTAPGHAFQIAGLTQEGVYYLQNVRLNRDGQLLQVAVPSTAVIQVTNALQTTVTVRQLTPDELRARGITVDPSNYDVYEYTFSFLVNGQTVEVPYPVIINRTTREATPVTRENPYQLPTDVSTLPPRWGEMPGIIPTEFAPRIDLPTPPPQLDDSGPSVERPSIHAAIVIPNSLAVLHQFFLVGLLVTNGAPDGSSVTLDGITATIDAPNQLRVVKSDPPSTAGGAVTITEPSTGQTFLVAQAQGNAEWTLEGLHAGTWTVHLDVRATFHSPGQPDIELEATPSATVVVHDARFNVTFSHPETIRKGLQYSTYTFITNVSDSAQDVVLSDDAVPLCTQGTYVSNVCRAEGTPSSFSLHLEPGETKSIEYKLQSNLTGYVFATAASIDGSDSAITSAAFDLSMGVSPTGVPLSPVTLVLPYYARPPWLSQNFLDAQLGLLGVGYSLATAPFTKQTAKFPRIVTTDVFTRAVDIARAGERIFIGEDPRDALANLSLDLLGNQSPLPEWDQFRRQEEADPAGDVARNAANALGNEISTAFGADGTFTDLASRIAGAAGYRDPWFLASVRGPSSSGSSPLHLKLSSPDGSMSGTGSAASWVRTIPRGEILPLSASAESGELALVGSSPGAIDLEITASEAVSGTLDLVFPSADGTSLIHASAPVNAAAGQVFTLSIRNGLVTSGDLAFLTDTPVVEPLRIVAARQDLHLDADGHVVTVLLNRPLENPPSDFVPLFDTDVSLDAAKFGVGYSGKRALAGAALQADGRTIRLNYDSALSGDASYVIHTTGIVDPASPSDVVPQVELRDSALILGTVIDGSNLPIPGADVRIATFTGIQWMTADADGRFLFEYVPRIIDGPEVGGNYHLEAYANQKKAELDGTVRLLHTLNFVNISFLGRGSAEGYVRYDNGEPVSGATVVVGSTMFNQFRRTTTDAAGHYAVTDLPVGPLTFSAQDADGNVAFAAGEIRSAGQAVLQDISIYRRPFPGTGTVRGRIVRSDDGTPVAGAHVGVYSQGYGLRDAYTGSDGKFEFTSVPSGFVTVLAEDYQVAPQSIAVDFDLKTDEVHETGDLALAIASGVTYVQVEGDVTTEDPLIPGSYAPVPGAIVQISGLPAAVADASGHYTYASVPQSFSGRKIRGYDPSTGRMAEVPLPSLNAGTNAVPIVIPRDAGSGTGTIRVHLLAADGSPVVGYHVFESGFPTLESVEKENGVYEFAGVQVGRRLTPIMATPPGGYDSRYGYQFTSGTASVSFPEQISTLTLRLPGQGSVRARIQQQTEAGVLIQIAGQLKLRLRRWSDVVQGVKLVEVTASTDGSTDAVFDQVPAGEDHLLETFDSVGYDSDNVRINYDGEVASRTLTLSSLSSVRGHVFTIDGFTPVPGAAVRLVDSAQDHGWITTGLDGSFEFRNVTSGSGFTVTAEWTQNGIFRTARLTGTTPVNGGRIDDLSLVLMRQGSVEGTIVDAGGAPIPFALFWIRELDFPSRTFGSKSEPLKADQNGRFRVNGIFAVPFRIDARDPINDQLTGAWSGRIDDEGQVVTPTITVGGAGVGTVRVVVVDPNASYAPVANAEVSLVRESTLFDFATTDGTGTVVFQGVPAAQTYTLDAYSKALAKSGSASSFTVAADSTLEEQITLVFSGEVTGTLSDPENASAPIAGASVTLHGDHYDTRTSTLGSGAFVFGGVREGMFRLEARDPLSIRRATGTGAVSTAQPTVIVDLQLEPTSILTVDAFLPDDAGNPSSTLAPLVTIDVSQHSLGGAYLRSSQTNGAEFPGLLRGVSYDVVVHEIGGLQRVVGSSGTFDANTATKTLNLVFKATGSVIVHVMQGSPAAPAPNVRVTASSVGSSISGYTDANGTVTLNGVPLGTSVSLQATTGGISPLTGAGSVSLASQSQPAEATILLGSYSGVTGYVEAEEGGASQSTRVLAIYDGVTLETRTDVTGRYTLQGIATPLAGIDVRLTYLGPDDQTIGATQSVHLANGAGLVEAPAVRLDSTPPHLDSIFPADGASSVAPDTQLRFTFSRAIQSNQLNNGYFQLFEVATSAQVSLTLASAVLQPDGSEIVSFAPPLPPPGQTFPLRSKTLYRIRVSGQLQDTAGHALGADLGASFTTSDYSNPQVVKVEPSPKLPLTKQGLRFGVTFSKPLDPAPWQAGGSGVMQLVRIDAIGGQPVGTPVTGTIQLDPDTAATLWFGPGETLSPASFYRLSISGVKDTEGRGLVDDHGAPLSVWTQDFFTYDETAPVVTLTPPLLNGVAIGEADPLYTGVLYTFPLSATNPDGSAATDLARVDFFVVDDSGHETLLGNHPLASVALSLPSGSTSFTLKAVATDLSGNVSAPATRSWSVQEIPALSIAATSFAPATIYAGNTVTETILIAGGALDATVSVNVTAEGSPTTVASATQALHRAAFGDPWSPVALELPIPSGVAAGSLLHFVATVVDARGVPLSRDDAIQLAADAGAPSIDTPTIEVVHSTVSGSPVDRFNGGDTYRVHVLTSDAETGISSVVFHVDGVDFTVTSGVWRSDLSRWEFVSPTITAEARNNDTTIQIAATAHDFGGNDATSATQITYNGLHDPNAPTVGWIQPLDGAAWPASHAGFTTRLRVYARSALPLAGTFDVPGAGTVTAIRGTDELYADLTSFDTPAAGTTLDIVAHVNDGDGGHAVDLPISVHLVDVTQTIGSGQTIAVDATHPLSGDSIIVDGGQLVPHIPLALSNLIVMNGGVVKTVRSTTTADQKLDLTVSDHLYIDAASSIDVTACGYLGGHQQNFDLTGTNDDARGMTLGRTVEGGTQPGASASYAGLGGEPQSGLTNPVYGSITDPSDLGSGGG